MAQSLSFAITNKNMLFLKDRIANAMLYVNENINMKISTGRCFVAKIISLTHKAVYYIFFTKKRVLSKFMKYSFPSWITAFAGMT